MKRMARKRTTPPQPTPQPTPQSPSAPTQAKYETVLYNCHVVDVIGGRILPNQCIAIRGKIIQRIDDSEHQHDYIEASTTAVDCKGSFVMPGLIDCHVHVTAFTANFPILETTSPAYVTARAIRNLEETLRRGFTTVRDAGGADHGLAKAIQEGYIEGPRLLFCGKALSQTGGHGDMRVPGNFANALSVDCHCCAGLGRVCDGDAEVRRAVRDEIRKGATHIKVMAGGGVSSPTDRITSTQFSLMELKAIVEEATAANVHVMAHAYTPRAIANAVRAGVKSIEHGNLLDEESAKMMAAAGTYLVPTLVTYEALAREGVKQGLEPDMLNKVGDVLDAGIESIGIAQKEGVAMCFGSDCLADMRDYQLREFALLEAAGLSREEALRSATVNAARLVGMEGQIGVVVEGAFADLLLVKQNPFESFQIFDDFTESCFAIWKEGKLVDIKAKEKGGSC